MKRLSVFFLLLGLVSCKYPSNAQPIASKGCNGVHEFYGNPLAANGRGSDLRILFFIGKRESILGCFKNTRAVKVTPLHKELAR